MVLWRAGSVTVELATAISKDYDWRQKQFITFSAVDLGVWVLVTCWFLKVCAAVHECGLV
jgi:hypothetical protein